MTPNEAGRRAIIENLRGTLAGGPSLTKTLEEERRLDWEREDVEDAQVERRFRVHTHPMGVRAGINLDKALTLAGEMEDAEILRKLELRK
jgi:hypothetical protein